MAVFVRQSTRRLIRYRLRNCSNMIRRRAAAAADQVDQACLCEVFEVIGGNRRGFVKTCVTHRVGQASVRVARNRAITDFGQLGDVRAHELGTEGAVQTKQQWLGVAQTVPKRFNGLPR